MKSKFDMLFDEVIFSLDEDNFITVEDIKNVAWKSDNILYETSPILRRPDNLFNEVKKIVLKAIADNDDSEKKISIKQALSDCSSLHDQDSELLKTLNELFKDHETAYFNVKLDLKRNIIFGMKGQFILPGEFQEGIELRELHYSFPTIRPVTILDENLKRGLKTLKDKLDLVKDFYIRKQKVIEFFKNNLKNLDYYGTIEICPAECTTDDTNIDIPTLDEAIEHECQHLCIFLMSIAKTCIFYRTPFF